MLSQVEQIDVPGKGIYQEFVNCLRKQCLPARTGSQQASHTVQLRADVTLISDLSNTGVQCHAHPDWRNLFAPWLSIQVPLGIESALEGLQGYWKAGTEGVTFRTE